MQNIESLFVSKPSTFWDFVRKNRPDRDFLVNIISSMVLVYYKLR